MQCGHERCAKRPGTSGDCPSTAVASDCFSVGGPQNSTAMRCVCRECKLKRGLCFLLSGTGCGEKGTAGGCDLRCVCLCVGFGAV